MEYYIGGFILAFLLGSFGFYDQDRNKNLGAAIIGGILAGGFVVLVLTLLVLTIKQV